MLLLSTVLSIGGYALISYGFKDSLDREINRSFEDLVHIRFLYETVAVNLLEEEDMLTDQMAKSIAMQLDANQLYRNYDFFVIGEDYKPIYQNIEEPWDPALVKKIQAQERLYCITKKDNRHIVSNACAIVVGGRIIYIQINRDISSLFTMKTRQINILTSIMLIMLSIGALGVYGLSSLITRPLRILSVTTRNIAKGNYEQRIQLQGQDEIAELAKDFNAMAEAIESKIIELKDEVRQREEFVANFAHELKTPMTSIIGYSDMLRSKVVEPDLLFSSANYIYHEGKRLESLSVKLLDLLVLKRQSYELKPVDAAFFLYDIAAVFQPIAKQYAFQFITNAQSAIIAVDGDLMKTLVLNILDNARKAPATKRLIELHGAVAEKEYVIAVKDYGCGIEEDEVKKIMEPFYMVDKSRSRNQHGAGLGLSLCKEIAEIHHSRLVIQSKVGCGTMVSIALPLVEKAEETGGESEA